MFWFILTFFAVCAAAYYVIPHFIADPNFVPEWKRPRCRGKGCGYALLISGAVFLFLLLPVWIKLPSFVVLFSDVCVWFIAKIKFVFDRQPDFAIGPYGIFGLCNLYYYHIPWNQVSGVHYTVNRTSFGGMHSMTFYSKVERKPLFYKLKKRSKPVKITLAPINGFNLTEIMELVEKYRPDKKIIRNEFDSRPSWLR